MILLDTHTLVWLDRGSDRLGEGARREIEDAHSAGEVFVSAISFWEVTMLAEKGRLDMALPVPLWREDLLAAGLREVVIEGDLGILAASLADFHGDPADRLITATAIARNHKLVTADQRILGWQGSVQRQDARI